MDVEKTLEHIKSELLQRGGFDTWSMTEQSVLVRDMMDYSLRGIEITHLREAARPLLERPDESNKTPTEIKQEKVINTVVKRVITLRKLRIENRKSFEIEFEKSIVKILSKRSKLDISEDVRKKLLAYRKEIKKINGMKLLSEGLKSICKYYLILKLTKEDKIMLELDPLALKASVEKDKQRPHLHYVNSPFDELALGEEINSIIVEIRELKTFSGRATSFKKISDFINVAFPKTNISTEAVRGRYRTYK